jgi:stage IV sporulation protein B
MKRTIVRLGAVLLSLWLVPSAAHGASFLIPVGQVVGLELCNDCVSIAAFDEALGINAQKNGLQIGDELLKIDGHTIDCTEDVRQALSHSDGQVLLKILRNDREQELSVTPQITRDGPRLGVYLRQGITGVGTVTYYDPETGTFGSLGHGINTPKGDLASMTGGSLYQAKVISVKEGKRGDPGQLRGGITDETPVGTLEKNTHSGVFGKTASSWKGEPLSTASPEEIRPGKATIRSTVSGNAPQEYSVEILKIYPGHRKDGRNMLIKITDPQLLKTTGGIVQGMSGSPILQDGKLIGAVTHVLVNDPTSGYGIFIENMLEAMG